MIDHLASVPTVPELSCNCPSKKTFSNRHLQNKGIVRTVSLRFSHKKKVKTGHHAFLVTTEYCKNYPYYPPILLSLCFPKIILGDSRPSAIPYVSPEPSLKTDKNLTGERI
jgi:hypothetical protein